MKSYAIRLILIGLMLVVGSFVLKENRNTPTVTVAGSNLEECEVADVAEGRRCYEEYLTQLLQSEGADAAVGKLAEFEQGSSIIKTYCHSVAHTLGHVGYEYYDSLSETLAHGTMDCFAGYFHGAIEVALPEAADYVKTVKEACSGTSERDGEFRFYQCVHGLGHGVTAYRDYDVEKALADCDLLSTHWRQESCWGGVFMENIDAKFVTAMDYTRQGRLQDDGTDFWPCFAVAEGYREPCFRMITARILPKHGGSFRYASGACETLTGSYRQWCFESYGRDAAGSALGSDMHAVNQLCDKVPADMRATCYQTASAVVATHFADPSRTEEICQKAGRYRTDCERGAQRIAESLSS